MPRHSFFPEDPVIPTKVTHSVYMDYRPLKLDHSKSGDKAVATDLNDDSSSDDGFQLFVDYARNREVLVDKTIYNGKWMLFHDKKKISLARGMTHHDYAWQFVMLLVDDHQNTCITSASCSTGWTGYYPVDPRSTDGLICCFTKDYRNKYEVKKAADAIREIYYYPKDMYYKTDQATVSGLYRCFGDMCVSLYKHTPDNTMYERDEEVVYSWKPVEFEE